MRSVPVEWCVGARELAEPRLSPDGTQLGVVVTAAGVSTLEVAPVSGDAPWRTLVATPAPRAGRGLGGGGWTWLADGSLVVASADGDLWHHRPGGARARPARRLTAHGPDASAQAPAASRDGSIVAYVVDQAEVWVVDVATRRRRRLDDGDADFCFDPAVLDDGVTVVWQAWDVPDMPWDSSRLVFADVSGRRRRSAAVGGAVQQPRPSGDGHLLSIRDDGGWANLWLDDRPLVDEPFEHAGPTWGLGQRSFAVSPHGRRVAFTRNERGFGRLCVVDVASGEVTDVARGVHGQLSWSGDRLAAVRTGARTPPQVVLYETGCDEDPHPPLAWPRRVAAVGPTAPWEEAELAEPELVEVAAEDGATLHARLYRGADPSGPSRLICWLHGGPTDQWQVTFVPRIAYWRSLGWNVLVPDHRGSTGHGRAYQQALRGRWGELDVADTGAVLRAAHAAGWGSPERTVLIGGSAGGFTVLGVLGRQGRTGEPLAAAGVVAYPVTDLAELRERSHRFERHYTDSLVGPPGTPALRDRSPIWFAQHVDRPLLVFHGQVDPVVPIEQSRVLVERMRSAGHEVELIEFPGEGHGFRLAEHQIDEFAHTAAFLTRHIDRGPGGSPR